MVLTKGVKCMRGDRDSFTVVVRNYRYFQALYIIYLCCSHRCAWNAFFFSRGRTQFSRPACGGDDGTFHHCSRARDAPVQQQLCCFFPAQQYDETGLFGVRTAVSYRTFSIGFFLSQSSNSCPRIIQCVHSVCDTPIPLRTPLNPPFLAIACAPRNNRETCNLACGKFHRLSHQSIARATAAVPQRGRPQPFGARPSHRPLEQPRCSPDRVR